MANTSGKRRGALSQVHSRIWDATISPGFRRANGLLDAKPSEPPEHLLHFTSASAIASILPNRTLRLSRARSSNDPKELTHAIAIAREEVSQPTGPLDRLFREELLASFEGRLEGKERRDPIDPHICCFTETGSADVVAHWAMYGRDGSGFALKFRGKSLADLKGVSLVQVNYAAEEPRAHLRRVLAVARETSEQAADYAKREGGGWPERSFRIAAHAFGGVVSLHASTMKAPEFAAEREWRLIHTGVATKRIKAGVEARGPVLRTYFDVKFDHDDLVSVIVGPVHADLNRPIVARLLEENGYSTTTVETGKVALRTLREGV